MREVLKNSRTQELEKLKQSPVGIGGSAWVETYRRIGTS
jgi:hypothetical protein